MNLFANLPRPFLLALQAQLEAELARSETYNRGCGPSMTLGCGLTVGHNLSESARSVPPGVRPTFTHTPDLGMELAPRHQRLPEPTSLTQGEGPALARPADGASPDSPVDGEAWPGLDPLPFAAHVAELVEAVASQPPAWTPADDLILFEVLVGQRLVGPAMQRLGRTQTECLDRLDALVPSGTYEDMRTTLRLMRDAQAVAA